MDCKGGLSEVEYFAIMTAGLTFFCSFLPGDFEQKFLSLP